MVCVEGLTIRSLVLSAICLTLTSNGVGVGVGVETGVGVGVGIVSGEGTSEVWMRKSWPALVRKASPFAPQRTRLPVVPLTPETFISPTGVKVLMSKARRVMVWLVPPVALRT